MYTRHQGPVIQIPRVIPSRVRISILGSISSVPHIDKIKIVQRKAARFVTNIYSREPGTVSNILHSLGCPTLETCEKDARLILLYTILHEEAAVNILKYVRRPATQIRQHHNDRFFRLNTSTNVYKYSFVPRTIRDWNQMVIQAPTTGEGVGVHGVRRTCFYPVFHLFLIWLACKYIYRLQIIHVEEELFTI